MAWNRPSEGAAKPTPKKPSAWRGVVAGLVVVVAAVCIVVFMGKDDVAFKKVERRPAKIKEVAPAVVSVAPTNAVSAKKRHPLVDYEPEDVFRDEKGILRYKKNPNLWAYDPDAKRTKPIILGTANRPSPFTHRSEREIAALLTARPGEKRYAVVNYNDPDFLQDFKDSLKETIKINPDDREDDKELKQAVIEAKKELAERMAKGEKLADILNETKREYEKLAVYKDDILKQVHKIIKEGNGEFTRDDVLDCVNAANSMLENNGIAPIKATDMVLWNVRLQAEKSGATEEEIQAAEDAAEVDLMKLEKEKKKANKEN